MRYNVMLEKPHTGLVSSQIRPMMLCSLPFSDCFNLETISDVCVFFAVEVPEKSVEYDGEGVNILTFLIEKKKLK